MKHLQNVYKICEALLHSLQGFLFFWKKFERILVLIMRNPRNAICIANSIIEFWFDSFSIKKKLWIFYNCRCLWRTCGKSMQDGLWMTWRGPISSWWSMVIFGRLPFMAPLLVGSIAPTLPPWLPSMPSMHSFFIVFVQNSILIDMPPFYLVDFV